MEPLQRLSCWDNFERRLHKPQCLGCLGLALCILSRRPTYRTLHFREATTAGELEEVSPIRMGDNQLNQIIQAVGDDTSSPFGIDEYDLPGTGEFSIQTSCAFARNRNQLNSRHN